MSPKFEKASLFTFSQQIEYSKGGVVSKQVLKNQGGNITLFAFDMGEGLSEHTTPFDALLQVLEGEAEISIQERSFTVEQGQSIILPASVPHAVHATRPMKMLLTMVRP